MTSLLTGIHHVTAIARDPIENHHFYTHVLGQRMVKKTVNFDDPLTYHLYFGDERGSPGTLLTHFPHPHAKLGVHGSPEILETIMTVPTSSLGYWTQRLTEANANPTEQQQAGEHRLAFEDPHGMRFLLIESDCASRTTGYAGADVAPEHAITGIEGAVIHVPDLSQTTNFLTNALGFEATEDSSDNHGRSRLHLGLDRAGERIELIQTPMDRSTSMGAGTVHHIAWRVPDDETQARVAEQIQAAGVGVTPVMDRQYFRSIYFRVPGGVIFEVATDVPGFDVDEPLATLGEALKLPPQFEPRRDEIADHLVPLTTSGPSE